MRPEVVALIAAATVTLSSVLFGLAAKDTNPWFVVWVVLSAGVLSQGQPPPRSFGLHRSEQTRFEFYRSSIGHGECTQRHRARMTAGMKL